MAAANSKASGTVVFLSGEVRAVSADGAIRILQAGDKVFAKEIIATSANAVVQIHFESGRLFDLTHDSTVIVDDAVADTTGTFVPHHIVGVQDLEALHGAMVAVATPDRHTPVAPVQDVSAESRGAQGAVDHAPAVVVEQANTTGTVLSETTVEGASMPGTGLSTQPVFLVQEEVHFQHAVSAVSGARAANPEGAGGIAEGIGDAGGTAKATVDVQAPGAAAPLSLDASDKLALGELLQGGQDANDLTAYLSFSYDAPTNSTTVNVHPAGSHGADHQIVLMGVDLTSRGELTTDAIIQNLLAGSKLHAEA